MQDWYRLNVVPTLGDGNTFVTPNALTGTLTQTRDNCPGYASRMAPSSYSGTAGPGALGAGFAEVARYAEIDSRRLYSRRFRWNLVSDHAPLATGRYKVLAVADAPRQPRASPAPLPADDLDGTDHD